MLLTIFGKRKLIIISKKGLSEPRLAFKVWAPITHNFEWILALTKEAEKAEKKGEKGSKNVNGLATVCASYPAISPEINTNPQFVILSAT
jgi:hypothetical protein